MQRGSTRTSWTRGGGAFYDGAQEDTFDHFSKEASQSPSFYGLRSVSEYKQAEEAKRTQEEQKLKAEYY